MIILRQKEFKFAHKTGLKKFNGGIVDRNDCGNADPVLVNSLSEAYKSVKDEKELDECLDVEFAKYKIDPEIQENVRNLVKSNVRYNNCQKKKKNTNLF